MISPPQANILIVDDTPNNLRFLSTTLTDQGYKVRSVTNGQMALTVAQAAQPDLILLDIKMPDMDGYEVCSRLKATEPTTEIPVIFLSALDETWDKVKAFQVGGVDYVSKPFQLEELLARIESQLKLQAAKAEIRQLNTELETRVRQRTAQLEKEIIERQRVQDQLLHVALHDALTGLPNRAWYMRQLGQVLDRSRQHEHYQFAVLLLDCDRFKLINDSLGHSVGDQLLIAIARRLESCVRPANTLARLGGDEFTILLEEIHDLNDATSMANNLLKELFHPFQLQDHEIFTNASIGVVVGDKTYEQPEHLLRDADTAMYQAKAIGKGCYQVFDATMHDRNLSNLQLETDLRRALERYELVVHYQPIIRLETGRIAGFEALVRWQHPERGLLFPGVFIPLAEETGLIVGIDLRVIRLACTQFRDWQQQGLITEPLIMSVNLSAKHFPKPDLVRQIDKILMETEINGENLKLEITESAIMSNAELAIALLEQLQARNIQLSIDDFGTGYSSLSYLHRFPLDMLKIDRSFVSGSRDDLENLTIAKTIVTLADSLGMSAIAEGIETTQQLGQLRELGCALGQGYFFAKPMPSSAAKELLKQPPQW
jgi:diguanylate cyclase (GGDEF)-like protein